MEAHLPHNPGDEAGVSGNGHAHALGADAPGRPPAAHSHVPTHYLPATQRRVTVFAAIIAVGLLAAFFVIHHFKSSAASELESETAKAGQQPVAVDVVRVGRASAAGILNLPGDARPLHETTIFGRTNGYVSKWLFDIGDHVTENQVLATIETPELDDQLKETNANFEQLRAQANVAATNAQFAKVSFDRWEAAAPEGAVSQQERDEKKAELDSANAKLAAAKAAVNLGDAQVQRLQTLEKFKNVVAPFDGVITTRFVDIGSLVTAGSTTNTTAIYTIAKSDQMRIYVDIPQPAVPDIHVGMQATATVRELPGEVFPGVVDRTAMSIDPKSRTLKTEVLVPNPKFLLLPGMYAEVTFKTNHAGMAVRVPAAALNFGPNGAQVAVVGDDQRISLRPVKIERDLGDFVEISAGVSENEMVALNAGNQIVSGQQVDAHAIETPEPADAPKPISRESTTASLPASSSGIEGH